MRKKAVLFAVLLIVTVLSACTEQNAKNNYFRGIPLLEDSENACDLTVTRYDDTALDKIYSFSGSLDDLHRQYPIEHLRKVDSTHYRFIFLGKSRIVVRQYDSVSNQLAEAFQGTLSKQAFSAIRVGQVLSSDEYESLDPNAAHPGPRYTGAAQLDSLHYTVDGYRIYLEYDLGDDTDTLVVKSMMVSLA